MAEKTELKSVPAWIAICQKTLFCLGVTALLKVLLDSLLLKLEMLDHGPRLFSSTIHCLVVSYVAYQVAKLTQVYFDDMAKQVRSIIKWIIPCAVATALVALTASVLVYDPELDENCYQILYNFFGISGLLLGVATLSVQFLLFRKDWKALVDD